jgi:hypothetical protein
MLKGIGKQWMRIHFVLRYLIFNPGFPQPFYFKKFQILN